MSSAKYPTVLCIASYEKGADFMRQCKKEGCKVILLTSQSLENADWPRDILDDIYFMPDVNKEWNLNDLIYGASYLARKVQINLIVALDDYDVEKAARLREHLRVPGMGDTTARYFRDKLAMRMRAFEVGILVPDFVHILNYDRINEFMNRFEPPYIIKPRMQAGAIGVKKIHDRDELWKVLEDLGDEQSFYLLEKFVAGEVYHVDSIIHKKEVVFAVASKYGLPPMEVAHQGRVFSSRTIPKGTLDENNLLLLNKQVLKAMGLVRGVSHTEFIKSNEDGRFYFLETSARVGGANISELVKAATGINLWEEWAKIEARRDESTYLPPLPENNHAAIMLSLARQEWPDMSEYSDPEVVWKLNKKNHAGLIVKSSSFNRVEELMKEYIRRFYDDFFATEPMKDKPAD